MRKRTLLLIAAILLTFGAGVVFNVQAAERQPVFRDLAWGDPVEALGGAVFLKDGGFRDETVYGRQNEVKTLGSLPVKRVVYTFWRNQLMRIWVIIDCRDKLLLDETLNMLVAKYGTTEWVSDNVVMWFMGDTAVTLFKLESEDRTVSFSLQSTSLLEAALRANKEPSQQDKTNASSW